MIDKQYVEHPWINAGTIEKRSYQEGVVKTAISGNTLVVLPTGLGKTSIAALVAANRLEKDMEKKIMFLAPTRPLVTQHKKSFERFLKIGPDELKVITGSDDPEARTQLYYKADIVFATPQTIENDLKNGRIDMKDFSLLIVDECHRCVRNYAYTHVAQKYMEQATDPLVLGLTASPGACKLRINEIKKNLSIQNVEIRDREDEDVKSYVHKLVQSFIQTDLSPELRAVSNSLTSHRNDIIQKLMSWRMIFNPRITKVDLLKLQADLIRRKTGASLAALSLVAELLKIDHAIVLAETQTVYALKKYLDNLSQEKSAAAKRLTKTQIFIEVYNTVTQLHEDGKEHPKIEKLEQIVEHEILRNRKIIVFAQYRDTVEKIIDILRKMPNTKPVAFIGQAKKSGKGMSQKEQIQIINEFRLGFYNILCCTSIGEEGLDISETDAVIFYEPIPSEIRKIQRSGRTARSKQGKVITLITKNTKDEAFYWSGYHKENRMKKILYEMQNMQKQGISDFVK